MAGAEDVGSVHFCDSLCRVSDVDEVEGALIL